MEKDSSQKTDQLIKQDLVISNTQFNEYLNVQNTGLFNMFDPKARSYTSLSESEWLYIIANYTYLFDLYMEN